MQVSKSEKSFQSAKNGSLFLALISLTVLTATFIISNLNLLFTTKLAIFISIVLLYIFFYATFYFRQRRKKIIEAENTESKTGFDEQTEAKLFALEEMNQ